MRISSIFITAAVLAAAYLTAQLLFSMTNEWRYTATVEIRCSGMPPMYANFFRKGNYKSYKELDTSHEIKLPREGCVVITREVANHE